ncbi:MAG: J domain-containing protein [Desulfobacterales bacterium]|jgi:DnaJ-class molecular chaperone|nr:J domain-containing protein [Desulfobacterales bacterium]
MTQSDCFSVLNVPPDATLEEVRRAYRLLVRRWHPDRYLDNPELRDAAQEKLKMINAAYQQAKKIIFETEAPDERPEPVITKKKSFFQVMGSILAGCFDTITKSSPQDMTARKMKNRAQKPGRPDANGTQDAFEKIFSNAMRARGSAPSEMRENKPERRNPSLRTSVRGPSAQVVTPISPGKKRSGRIAPVNNIKRVGKVK